MICAYAQRARVNHTLRPWDFLSLNFKTLYNGKSLAAAPLTVILKTILNAMGSVSSVERAVMPITREAVNQLIASDAVVIFSKTRCPYCKMAKQVFDSLQKKYTAIELDERNDADEIQTILGEMTGARTVPRVFVNGECLGGGTDVKKLYDSGELLSKF